MKNIIITSTFFESFKHVQPQFLIFSKKKNSFKILTKSTKFTPEKRWQYVLCMVNSQLYSLIHQCSSIHKHSVTISLVIKHFCEEVTECIDQCKWCIRLAIHYQKLSNKTISTILRHLNKKKCIEKLNLYQYYFSCNGM